MLAPLAEGPWLLSRTELTGPRTAVVRPSTQILSVTFARSTVRSDRVVAARLSCTGAHGRRVTAEVLSPGFEVELLPERSQQDGHILLALRVHRRLGTVRRACLVRFCVGEAAAVASIRVVS